MKFPLFKSSNPQILKFSNLQILKFSNPQIYLQHTKKNNLQICKLFLYVWCDQESNRGHKDFQSFALPTELSHHFAFKSGAKLQHFIDITKFLYKKMLFFLHFTIKDYIYCLNMALLSCSIDSCTYYIPTKKQ